MLQRCKHNHCVHILFFTSNRVPKSDSLLIIWSYLVPYRPQNSQPDNPPGHVSTPGFLITSKRIPHLKRSYAVSGPRGPGTKKVNGDSFSQIVRWYMMAPLLWNLVLVSPVRTLAKKYSLPCPIWTEQWMSLQCAQSVLFALPYHSILHLLDLPCAYSWLSLAIFA